MDIVSTLTDPKFLIKAFFCVSLLFFILGSFQANADAVVSGVAVIVAGATIAWPPAQIASAAWLSVLIANTRFRCL